MTVADESARAGEGATVGGRDDAPPAAAPPLSHVAVVLVEPVEPGNLGAVARSMWNLGARDLRVVVPDARREAHLFGCEARGRACHGLPLLEAAGRFRDLRSALAGIGRVFAFTARTGRFRQPRADLFDAARRVAADRDGRPALLFGREDRGLTDEEVAFAHELVTIPAPGGDPVMNLSHAATIALWEVVRAGAAFAPAPAARAPERSATAEDRRALRDDFERLLAEVGLPPGAHGGLPDRIVRRFLDLFDRGGGEHADFSMLRGVFVSVRRTFARLAAGAASGAEASRAEAPSRGEREG